MSCLKKKKKKSFICELFCRLFSCKRKKFVSKWEVEAGERLDFPIQGRKGKIVIDWGDESRDVIKTGNDKYISHIYTERGIYTIIVKGTITQWSCNIYDDDDDGDNANNSRKLIRIVSYERRVLGLMPLSVPKISSNYQRMSRLNSSRTAWREPFGRQ